MSATAARQDHLSNRGKFSVTSLRPPVPGEETRANSCHASGNKSNLLSGNISSHPLDNPYFMNSSSSGRTQSVSLTPPAPLGYEPEGNDSYSPRQKEGDLMSSGPSYLKWAEELVYLLRDSDGVSLFKDFLEKEQGGSSAALDFWFACSGMKMVASSDTDRIVGLVKLIYKKYIKGENLRMNVETKKRIVELLRTSTINRTIFDSAQAEIESQLRTDAYPLFLKSDTYLQYIQGGGESPKVASSSNSSGSDGLEMSGLGWSGMANQLETVPEGHELNSVNESQNSFIHPVKTLSLTPSALLATRRLREGSAAISKYYGSSYPSLETERSKPLNPYHTHISYAPVSAQDSELQSLSSDALTDDTKSYTDSSLDGVWDQVGQPVGGKAAIRMYHRAIKRYAEANKQTDLSHQQQFIPRTQRIPADCNQAETNPTLFARMLIKRLEELQRDIETDERVRLSMQRLNETDSESEGTSSSTHLSHYPHNSAESNMHNISVNHTVSRINNSQEQKQAVRNGVFHNSSLASMLASAMSDGGQSLVDDDDESAQSILDEHVSSIWKSAVVTPARTPGHRSPRQLTNQQSQHNNHVSLQSLQSNHFIQRSSSNQSFSRSDNQNSRTDNQNMRINTQNIRNDPRIVSGGSLNIRNDTQNIKNDTQAIQNGTQPERHPIRSHSSHQMAIQMSLSQPNSSSHMNTSLTSNQWIHRADIQHVSHSDGRSHDDRANMRSRSGQRGSLDENIRPRGDISTADLWSKGQSSGALTNARKQDGPYTHNMGGKDSKHESFGGAEVGGERFAGVAQAGRGLAANNHTSHLVARSFEALNQGSVGRDMREFNLLHEEPNERIMMWMLDGGGGGSGNKTRYSTDGSDKTSSHKHSSHRSASSGGKKSSTHRSRRSESLDRSKLDAVNFSTVSDSANLLLNGSLNTTALPLANERENRSHSGVRKPLSGSKQASVPSMPPPQTSNMPVRSAFSVRTVSASQVPTHGAAQNSIGTVLNPVQLNQHTVSQSSTQNQSNSVKQSSTVVGYYLCDEPIPYRSTLPGDHITLGMFKQLLSKKGNYRYFFKTVSNEFDSGVVHEEIQRDEDVLPMWQGKIFAKVERVT